MTKHSGRPMKYRKLLEALDDDTIYSPATVVAKGERDGFFDEVEIGVLRKKAKLKARHSLARFSTNHRFPDAGDGMIRLSGQAPLRGWLGKRWKAALANKKPRFGAAKGKVNAAGDVQGSLVLLDDCEWERAQSKVCTQCGAHCPTEAGESTMP